MHFNRLCSCFHGHWINSVCTNAVHLFTQDWNAGYVISIQVSQANMKNILCTYRITDQIFCHRKIDKNIIFLRRTKKYMIMCTSMSLKILNFLMKNSTNSLLACFTWLQPQTLIVFNSQIPTNHTKVHVLVVQLYHTMLQLIPQLSCIDRLCDSCIFQ